MNLNIFPSGGLGKGLGCSLESRIHQGTFMAIIHGHLTIRGGEAHSEKEYAVRKLGENNRTLGVTSWLKKTCLVFVSLQQQFCIHPWTEVSSWELWDPVHMPGGAGGVPYVYASGNKHGDLSPGVAPAVASELALVPLSHGLGAPVLDNQPRMREPLWNPGFLRSSSLLLDRKI